MTDEPGFAALETTIATALCSVVQAQATGRVSGPEPTYPRDFTFHINVEQAARVVCEAITTQSRIVYQSIPYSAPIETDWEWERGIWFPLAGRGETRPE